jgi:hypothetical protein
VTVKHRDCIEQYRVWADECRLPATGSPLRHVGADGPGAYAFFHLPVPESYSAEKRQALYGRMHRVRKGLASQPLTTGMWPSGLSCG